MVLSLQRKNEAKMKENGSFVNYFSQNSRQLLNYLSWEGSQRKKVLPSPI